MSATARRRDGRDADSRRAPRARDVVSAAARAGRRHWRRVLVAGLVVFGLSALAETLLDALARHHQPVVTAVIEGLLAGAAAFGDTFFAGLLDKLVGEASHDEAAPRTLTVLRRLPYGRLILADVLVSLFALLGTLALVLPGILVFTLLSLSGPIVNIEGRSATGALRRSAKLVRGRFWLTLGLVGIPVWLASAIGDLVEDTAHGLPLVFAFLVRVVALVILAVGPGLVQVELAYRLIEVDAESRRA